jgi:uncharacterized protein (DUF983 family)
MEEEILDFYCHDEALECRLSCPSCDIGRLFCSSDSELYACDTCDTEFTVSDDPLKDVI